LKRGWIEYDCRRPARVEASMMAALASRFDWRRRGK
jgi:hypothetical protein